MVHLKIKGSNLRQNVKKAKRELMGLIREVVFLRDGAACLRCGRRERLQMSHIYPKGKYRKLELDVNNIKTLCAPCHLFWWHRNPIEAWEWLQTAIPAERLKRLKLAALDNSSYRLDIKLLKLELEQLKKRYKKGG